MNKLFRKISKSILWLGLSKRYFHSDKYLESLFAELSIGLEGVSLDLGSGPMPRNPFGAGATCGVDVRSNADNNVYMVDLSIGKLPFDDASFDFVTAYDVLEHIPRVSLNSGATKYPLILLINEVFRVLKKDGIFYSIQPCYPFSEAFQDPTHVNIMTEDTLDLYFCEQAWARIYGYEGSFFLMADGWYASKYFSFMRKSSQEKMVDPGFIQK